MLSLFSAKDLQVMDPLAPLNVFHHGFRIPVAGKNIHAEGESRHAINGNTLMNGQYIAMKTGNGLQNSGKKSWLIVHLNDKRSEERRVGKERKKKGESERCDE